MTHHGSICFVGLGARLPGAKLAEQAQVTLELASQHLNDLTPFGITKARLGEYRGLLGRTKKGSTDRVLTRQETALATEKQNRTLLEAKDWLRTLLAIADNAFVAYPATNRAFNSGAKIGASLPRLVEAISERLELAKSHASALAEWGGTTGFIKQGQDLLNRLVEVDTRQETLLKGITKTTQDYYAVKGELLIALKRINRAAKAAFLNDRAVRSKFNLDVLYRGATTRKPAAVVAATQS